MQEHIWCTFDTKAFSFRLMLYIVSWQFECDLCASFYIWKRSETFCDPPACLLRSKHHLIFLHADGTQLECPSGDVNNELNHCTGDEPLGESEHLLWLPCVLHAVLFHLWLMYVGLDISIFVSQGVYSQLVQFKITPLVQFSDLKQGPAAGSAKSILLAEP